MKALRIVPYAGIMLFVFLFSNVFEATAYTHTMTLRLGSRSTQVLELQRTLNANGYLVSSVGAGSPGMETTYFGTRTRAAVMAFQSARSLSVDGIVGPVTGNVLAALTGGTPTPGVPCPTGYVCTPTTPTPPVPCPVGYVCTPATPGTPPTGLSGLHGQIEDFRELSPYSNERVGEGQRNVRVAGFEIHASDGGDIAIRSLRLRFDPAGSTGSTRFDRYVDTVSIWQGETRIGTAAASSFTRSSGNIYSATFTLENSIVRASEEEDFYITVNAVRNLDSADIAGDSWSVQVDRIRYQDGSGVLVDENNIGDIDTMNVPMNFVSFSSAADTNLRISLASDSPDDQLSVINRTRETRNVTLLSGTLRLDGDSDVTIDEFPVTLTVSGTADDVDDVVRTLTLRVDGNTYTENVSTSAASATVTFDRMDFDIDAGDTVSFTITADINELRAGVFEEGDTIKAEVTSTNRSHMEVENERGDDLSDDNEKSGTAIGGTLELRSSGVGLSLVSTDTGAATGSGANDDIGTFRIRFTVRAVGGDVYVASTAGAVTYAVDKAGTAVADGITAVLDNATDSSLTSAGNYLIEEGEEETFVLFVSVKLPEAGDAGFYRTRLTGLKWGTEDSDPLANTYTFNLHQFATSYQGLN